MLAIMFTVYCIVAPEYSLDPDYLEVPAGSSPCVNFTVISDPPLSESTRHSLSKADGSRARKFKVDCSHITFHNVGIADSGLYTISCCNSDGDEGQGTIELVITASQTTPLQYCVSKTSKHSVL